LPGTSTHSASLIFLVPPQVKVTGAKSLSIFTIVIIKAREFAAEGKFVSAWCGHVDGEFTSTDDVADAVLFFAGARSNALTGQSMVVSHGWFMQ